MTPLGSQLGASLSVVTALAFALLEQVAKQRLADFCGLGVVFYRQLDSIPMLALGDQARCDLALPVQGTDAIASTLANISSASSPWHDGFHLVKVTGPTLTHVSQYLAPPVGTNGTEVLGSQRPTGARHMTALLVSQLKGVACVGLLASHAVPSVFERGVLVPSRQEP
jgi:hypothetical protein